MRIRITNASDLLRAARGEIRIEVARRVEADAETDRGVAKIVLPARLRDALGLADLGPRRVRYSDGHQAELRWTGSVLLEVAGRRLMCDGLVEPGRRMPLVGGGALEALDLVADPVTQAVAIALAPPLSPGRPAVPRCRDWWALLRAWRWGSDPRLPMEPARRRRPMQTIDETIAKVENLYRTLTGLEPPPGSVAFPPEKDPLAHVTDQIERLSGALATSQDAATVCPALSVWESETELRFCLEMPGVAREGVRLGFATGTLTVAASTTIVDTAFHLRARERPAGGFRRTLLLPPGIAERDVSAQMRDGILEIRIARREPSSEARPIPIA